MKKTDKQLQQEVTEIRRFIDGDSKQTAKKVIPIAYNVAIGTMIGDVPGSEQRRYANAIVRVPALRAEIRLRCDAHEIN